jgi:formate/nitrite transporter FocA (FNT family)
VSRGVADEQEEAEERTSPTSKIVYEAILSEGSDELERSSSALAWSGLAAGLSMGFSFLGVGLIRAFLPDSPWVPLVASFGYTLGFLIVILGRQQLFTENTLTVILPLMRRRDGQTLGNVLRLWAIVLVANVLGAGLFGLVLARTQAVEPAVYQQLHDTAITSMSNSFGEGVLRGVFAGWLIALVVWLLPFAETARVSVIIIVTYIVGLAQLAHVIVQSVETSFLVFAGYISVSEAVLHGVLPALLGNIIGGVALVAAINHAQVVGHHQGADT